MWCQPCSRAAVLACRTPDAPVGGLHLAQQAQIALEKEQAQRWCIPMLQHPEASQAVQECSEARLMASAVVDPRAIAKAVSPIWHLLWSLISTAAMRSHAQGQACPHQLRERALQIWGKQRTQMARCLCCHAAVPGPARTASLSHCLTLYITRLGHAGPSWLATDL